MIYGSYSIVFTFTRNAGQGSAIYFRRHLSGFSHAPLLSSDSDLHYRLSVFLKQIPSMIRVLHLAAEPQS